MIQVDDLQHRPRSLGRPSSGEPGRDPRRPANTQADALSGPEREAEDGILFVSPPPAPFPRIFPSL